MSDLPQPPQTGADSLGPTATLPAELEPPISLVPPPGGTWPIHVLTPWVARFVEQFAHERQVAPEIVAQNALAVFSAALAGKFEAVVRKRWTEQLNLYLCTIALSGERKSTVVSFMRKIVHEYEADQKVRSSAEFERVELEARQKKAEIQALLKDLDTTQFEDERSMKIDLIMQAKKDLTEMLGQRVDSDILVDNITVEALIDKMARTRGRAAFISPEAGVLEELVNSRYGKGDANIDPFLQGFGNETIKVDRKTSGSAFVKTPYLTCSFCAQPKVIELVANDDRLERRGIIGRFLWSWPKSKVGTRIENAAEADEAVVDAFKRNTRSLLEIPDRITDDGELDPIPLRFSDEARAVFVEWTTSIERRMAEGGDLRPFMTWGNRAGQFCARIAGILAILDGGGAPPGNTIQVGVVHRAIELMSYYQHDMMVMAAGKARPIGSDDATKIVSELKRLKLKRFEKRELMRRLGTRSPNSERLGEILAMLVDSGHLLEGEPNGRKPTWVVNRNVVSGATPDPEPERLGPYAAGAADHT